MARRTRHIVSMLALVGLSGVAGCSADPASPQPMREALRSGAPIPLGSAWDEVDERVVAGAHVAAPGDAVAWVDHARLLAGRDSRLAGMYQARGAEVEAASCGDLRLAPPLEGEWVLVGEADPAAYRALAQLAPRLLGWVAGCPVVPDTQAPVRIALAAGAPVGVAWWPVDGVLLVNPAMLRWTEGAAPANEQLRASEQALFGSTGYADCLEQLGRECESCIASSGTNCESLFASGETCVELSAMTEGIEQYCLWRTYESERSRIACIAQGIAPYPLDRCYVVGVSVVSTATLAQAILNYGPGQICTDVLEACALAEPTPPPPFVPNWTAQDDFALSSVDDCTSRLQVYCDSCLAPEGPGCPPLFPGSTGRTDCFDLSRPENAGLGESMYCTSLGVTGGNIACLNAAGVCVERFYWEDGIAGYNDLLLAMSHMVTDVERCAAQVGECKNDTAAFPDYNDTGDTPPTFDPFASSGGSGGSGSGKCGG